MRRQLKSLLPERRSRIAQNSAPAAKFTTTMGSVNSTSASRSTASDFERRKTLAAERMYRNHYSSSSSGEFKPTNLTFKQKLFKKQQDLLYSYHASDRKRASALHSLEAGDIPTRFQLLNRDSNLHPRNSRPFPS